MGTFELSGKDITITFNPHDKTLVVRGEHLPGLEHTFSDVKTSHSDIGQATTVVLLPSSRDGRKISLHVLLPSTSAASEDVPVTGLAVVVTDFTHVVGGAPPVRHAYDTRPLTGKLKRAS